MSGTLAYAYDGEGHRVKKVNGSQTTRYLYDAFGKLAAEYAVGTAPSGAPQPECSTCYLTVDHLGSTRVLWDSTGVKGRYDYMPFGDAIPSDRNKRDSVSCAAGVTACYAGSGSLTMRFTGKERDAETSNSAMGDGLDYFGARYFSGAQGRFTSPDLPFADQNPADPQSWNLYSYVRNNALTFLDPTGRSTHTNSAGDVLAVYDDDDLGVYRHDKKNLKNWNGTDTLAASGKGVGRMGETEYWDEFRAHDSKTGAVLDQVAEGARIIFGSSFDSDVQRLGQQAAGLGLVETARQSRNGQPLDIKTKADIAPFGPNTGRLLNGEYATARSAGNFLAGYDGALGTFMGGRISFDTYMKMAGALQTGNWSNWNAFRILTFGTSFGPAPWYGEVEYTGRRVRAGFQYGVSRR